MMTSKAKYLLRVAADIAEHTVLPRLPLPHQRSTPIPSTVMLLIYRQRNVAMVERLVRQARSTTCGVRPVLWGLDGCAPSLQAWTAGTGPGLRSALLTRLLVESNAAPQEYVLIADDDAEFAIGTLTQFIRLAVAGGFVLAQPTHTQTSHYSFRYTCGRPHLIARSTLFMEIGPMVLVSPRFRDRVFPMNLDLGMGWAETVVWFRDKEPTERFGQIDAVRIRHCHPVGIDYDTQAEQANLNRLLAENGMNNLDPMLRTVDRWYRWQVTPPWLRKGQSSRGMAGITGKPA